jgi:hypothetical protein
MRNPCFSQEHAGSQGLLTLIACKTSPYKSLAPPRSSAARQLNRASRRRPRKSKMQRIDSEDENSREPNNRYFIASTGSDVS